MDFSFFENFRLPSHDEIFSLTERMCDVLENEKESWRPLCSDGNAGSLLDFSDSDLPVLIIPDLHARPSFLRQICDFQINGKTVLELLESKSIHVVFAGDALHSEKVTRERWKLCYAEYENSEFSGPFMKEEMAAGLSLLMMLFELKTSFSENFHFLKGNHENILNESGGGDYPFKKYAEEGSMVKRFISEYYGDDVLYLLSIYEKALPLIYVSKKCVISHAEPARAFSKEELINARLDGNVVAGLVWTNNNEALENSVSETVRNIFGKDKKEILWFAGHRPVNGKYSIRQNGRFIQIHNPLNSNIVYLDKKESFDPETDILNVIKQENSL